MVAGRLLSRGTRWYQQLERNLEGSDDVVRLVLVGVVVVAVVLLVQPSRSARLAGALYFALP